MRSRRSTSDSSSQFLGLEEVVSQSLGMKASGDVGKKVKRVSEFEIKAHPWERDTWML